MGERGPKTGSKKASESAKRRVQAMKEKYGENYYSEQMKQNAITRKQADPDCFVRMGKLGGEARKLADPDCFVKMGEQGGLIGGNTTFARHGHEHFVGLGQRSAQKRREAQP